MATNNITPDIVIQETLSSSIESMDGDAIQKYINRAVALVWWYITLSQFLNDDGDIVFPDDMIQAIVYIIEYIYVDGGMFGQWPNSLKSERIWDYSYMKGWSSKLSSIDLPYSVQMILDNYRMWWGNIETTIGWYDRTYDDSDTLDILSE